MKTSVESKFDAYYEHQCKHLKLKGLQPKTIEAFSLFYILRKLLKEERYCCLLVDVNTGRSANFPIPWAVSLSARTHLRLRDEKVGLNKNEDKLLYCLVMQAVDDGRPEQKLLPNTLNYAAPSQDIPGWVIPKPPPRKKNEILHPAKYPETLIGQFIEIFTKPGENVFDPMVVYWKHSCRRSERSKKRIQDRP